MSDERTRFEVRKSHESVLRPGGAFCGCFYIKGENRRTDWFIEHLYTSKGFLHHR